MPASSSSFLIPRWMALIPEHQLRTDPGCLPAGPGGLNIAQVTKEIHDPRQSLGDGRVRRAIPLKPQDIQNLAASSNQPTKSIGKRKRHSLSRTLIELAAVGIFAALQMIEGPQPHSHGRGQG